MTDVTLDASQLEAVRIAPTDRQIVIAGPGAGKSQVVGALAEHLIEGGLYPDEILLISFSRAAVKVARERTAHLSDDGIGVTVSTLDSLAARILLEVDDGEFTGYDASIVRATKALREQPGALLDQVRHVIVDEVQDVVGVRAEFLLEILGLLVPSDIGFSLLGDPLQSIYDFQIDDPTVGDSERLLLTVQERFGAVERQLTGEYRSRTADAREAMDSRQALMRMDPRSRLRDLRSHSTRLLPLGVLDSDATDDIVAWKGTTALLCDTNIRAALVAERAAESGLHVRLAARATEPVLPGWIASALHAHSAPTIDRDEFLERLTAVGAPAPLDQWRLLLKISRSRRDLDLAHLADGMRLMRNARDLATVNDGGVSASTVHRAKGLEFDNVVLVDPLDWGRPGEDADALTRLLFVALTRARDRLVSVEGIDTRGWSINIGDGGSRFWAKRAAWGGRRITHVLLEPAAARYSGPLDTDLRAAVGEALDWHRSEPIVTVDGEELPSWTASVGGETVATTGEDFAGVIRRTLFDRSGTRWPNPAGGRVEGLETVVGPPGSGAARRHAFWLGARVSGPLELRWND